VIYGMWGSNTVVEKVGELNNLTVCNKYIDKFLGVTDEIIKIERVRVNECKIWCKIFISITIIKSNL